MKRFLITLLAVIAGGIILSILPIFFMLAVIVASSGQSNTIVMPNSILAYDLSTAVSDIKTETIDFSSVMSNNTSNSISLRQLLNNIKKASSDNNIKGIVLRNNTASANFADMEEIRKALIEFKESGKFIYYMGSSMSMSSMYLASVADGIYVAPEGMVEIYGVSSLNAFYKNALDYLGVDMQVIRHGKFKSAVEPYVQTSMSDASRLQMQRIVDGIWEQVRNEIATARGIEESLIDNFVDEMLFVDSQSAVDAGLIDSLMYNDQFIDMIRLKMGLNSEDNLNFVEVTSYTDAKTEQAKAAFAENKVAVVYAMGEIAEGTNKSDQQNIYAADLIDNIQKASNDNSVKAIVLRVSSPGGSALASDLIWREIECAKEKKPVVVSMGEYAASGGYYISCGANYIFAQPNTLTGSIGVFGLIPCTKKLTDNIGITFDGVSSNKSSAVTIVTPLTDKQRQYLTKMVEKTYDTFTKRCADGRGTTQTAIDSIGQGRVWLGKDALNMGLVDELGGIEDAIEKAKQLANVSVCEVVEYPKTLDMMERIMMKMKDSNGSFAVELLLGDDYVKYERLKRQVSEPSIKAIMEYGITIR